MSFGTVIMQTRIAMSSRISAFLICTCRLHSVPVSQFDGAIIESTASMRATVWFFVRSKGNRFSSQFFVIALPRERRKQRRSCATLMYIYRYLCPYMVRIRLILSAHTVYGPYLYRNGSTTTDRVIYFTTLLYLTHRYFWCFQNLAHILYVSIWKSLSVF